MSQPDPVNADQLATFCSGASKPDAAMMVVMAISQVLDRHRTISYPSLLCGVAVILAEVAEDSPQPELCGPTLERLIAKAQEGLALARQPAAGQA